MKPASPIPPLPLPEPIRGSEIPSFAHRSIITRLPEIARRVISENDLLPEQKAQLQTLIAEIPSGHIRPVEVPLAPDAAHWHEYVQPYLAMDWLQVPWMFAEFYFYERILEATGYYQPGQGQHADPFRKQKQAVLQSALEAARPLCEHIETMAQAGTWKPDDFERLLKYDLSGNQVDLSRWPGGTSKESGVEAFPEEDHLLLNDSHEAAKLLSTSPKEASRVDFLLDNAGYELVCDLAVADYLLSTGIVPQVHFHLKAQPVYVSDTMEKDVQQTLEGMLHDTMECVQSIGKRMQAYLDSGQLALRANLFWTSPLPGWEMPAELREDLAGAGLLISKGDANYRRLLGDRHWPLTQSLQELTAYLPGPLLAIRSLKSELIVGLCPSQAEAAQKKDPDWLTDGKWGIIQM